MTAGVSSALSARTIVENCGSTLILRCSASERGGTAEFAWRLIGKGEVIRRQTSRSDAEVVGQFELSLDKFPFAIRWLVALRARFRHSVGAMADDADD